MEPFWAEYPRDVLLVRGADARSYLQSQLSNDVESMRSGYGMWAFALEPTGKVAVLLRVTMRHDGSFVLDTDAGYGEALIARLRRFRIRVDAEIEPLDWECVAVRGHGAEDGVVAWGAGYDLLPAEAPPPDVRHGTADDLERARIDAAWPKMGAEILPGVTIPAETGITDVAVSFTKGCYPGQELVERMASRGAVAPRQVRRIEVPAGTAVGDEVDADGHRATVTSVLGAAALALVARR